MVRVIQFAGCGSSSSTGVISGGGIREFYEWGPSNTAGGRVSDSGVISIIASVMTPAHTVRSARSFRVIVAPFRPVTGVSLCGWQPTGLQLRQQGMLTGH